MKAIVNLILCSWLTLPAFAQIEDGVPPGFDIWRTLGDGNTFYSMEEQPIPAGFFCEGSAAFSGTLDFEGVPIKAFPAGALGKADTIIERLDFAPYDENGLSYSRLVARALNLKAQPIENECGTWDVAVSLTKNQPVTEVSYVRDEANDGYFTADLVLNFRMTFLLRGAEQVKHELVRTVHFSRLTEIPYTVDLKERVLDSEKTASKPGISYDSDGDGIPDSLLEIAHKQEFPTIATIGKRYSLQPSTTGMLITQSGNIVCHADPNSSHQHCINICEADTYFSPFVDPCEAPDSFQ